VEIRLSPAVLLHQPPLEILREPLVEIGFHWQFLKPIASDISTINTPSFSSTAVVAHNQLPLKAILEVQISQNTREEVSIFIFWKKVAKKG
jgi:hypothetical protein